MHVRLPALSLSCLVLALGCAAPARPGESRADPGGSQDYAPPSRAFSESLGQEPEPWEFDRHVTWRPRQTLLQGFIGASYYDQVTLDQGSTSVDGDDGELDQLPVLGGGAQWKLGGKRVDFGFEGLFSFSGRTDAVAFSSGSGGAVVAVDVDLVLFDLYGGPFVSVFLGDKLRLYAAAGPLMEFAEWGQTDENSVDENGSGYGTGLYARLGLELVLPGRRMVGIGARWSNTQIDLDNDLGDLEIDGLQAFITVTEGL